MAPGNSNQNKRKRPERGYSHDDGDGRPSPHRPDSMSMAQNRQTGNRGGRGGAHRKQGRHSGDAQNLIPGNSTGTPIRNSWTNPSANAYPETHPTPSRTEVETLGQAPDSPEQTALRDADQAFAPFAYKYLSEADLKEWENGGRATFLEKTRGCSGIERCLVLQDLIRAALERRLDPYKAGNAIQELIATDGHGDANHWTFTDCFLQTLSLLDDAECKDPALSALVRATDVDPDLLRMELDIALLGSLGLVRNTFGQMRTRKTTNILYRQANFNLLREESEGYAKLLTKYFDTAQEASSTREYNHGMAEDAFQRVMALVGAFDLDVGRVLDITLDISANLLVKAYGFFMKFYRCSSWWPSADRFDNVTWSDHGFNSLPIWALPGHDNTTSSEDEKNTVARLRQRRDTEFWRRAAQIGMDAFQMIGSCQITNFDAVSEMLSTVVEPELDAKGKEARSDNRKRINEDRKYMREMKTLPPMGNPDAAQLLGFKLRYYASPVRDTTDAVPENLIALAALLIKIGFISLRDLYPHLYPPDSDMPEWQERLEKENRDRIARERPGAGPNALALAGVLSDDTPTIIKTLKPETERSEASTPKPEVKEEPGDEKLPTPDNQKIMLLRALLLVGALPEALFILGRFPWLIDADVTMAPHLLRIVRHMLSQIGETVCPLAGRQVVDIPKDQIIEAAGASFKFGSRAPKKSIRWLGLDRTDEKDGQDYRYYYADWADNVPVCQDVDDVFTLCDTFIGLLDVRIGQDQEVLGTLVRLARHSLEHDADEQARSRWLELIKRLLVPASSFTKHNPGLTNGIYDLLSRYPISVRYNIYTEWFTGKTSRLPAIREAFAYNKAEARDVLRRLSNENVKKFARALGKVSYSCPGVMMMYMISQLENYSNMIPALVECARFFSAMSFDVLNWCLINALNGAGRSRMQDDGMLTSPWLQALSSYVALLFARYHNVLNPSPVLQYLAAELRAERSTDLEMFEQLLQEMAGIKAETQFTNAQVQAMSGGEHLQSLILQQLSDMRHVRKPHAKRLLRALSEPDLIGQLLVSVAQESQMYQHRNSSSDMPLKVLSNNIDRIQQVLSQYLDVLKTNLSAKEFAANIPNVVSLMKDYGIEGGVAFTIYRHVLANDMAEFDEAKRLEELEEKKRKQNGDSTNQSEIDGSAEDKGSLLITSPWHPVLQPVIEKLEQSAHDLVGRVGTPFYVTFWTLAQSDIVVFTESYTLEVEKISRQISQMVPEKNDSSSVVREKERKKKALQETSDKLRQEVKSRVALYSKVSSRLSQREKAHWFPKLTRRQELDARHVGLLQECFIPRATMSAVDAHYSYLMLRLLHDKGTPGFSTANLLSQLFRKHELTALMFQCTALEVQNLARFLDEILRMLLQWHSDKAVYDKEAIGTKTKLPGFAKPLESDNGPEVFVDYESFRRLLSNWHTALSGALQICLESAEYAHIRNGIMMLKGVCQHFPALNYMGRNLLSHVVRLSDDETRQDLKLMARSLIAPLKKRESAWVNAAQFRLGDPVKEAKAVLQSQPQSDPAHANVKELDANAADFVPSETNGRVKGENIEDGEVEDEKQAPLAPNSAVTTTISTKQQRLGHDSIANGAPSFVERAKGDSLPARQHALSNPQTPALTPQPNVSSQVPNDNRGRTYGPSKPASRIELADGRNRNAGSDAATNTTVERGSRQSRLASSISRDHTPQPTPRSEAAPKGPQAPAHDRRESSQARPESGRALESRSDQRASTVHQDRAGFISSVVSAPAPTSAIRSTTTTVSQHSENPARLAQINNERHSRGPMAVHQSESGDKSSSDSTRVPHSRASSSVEVTPTGPRGVGTARQSSKDGGYRSPAAESSYGRLNNSHETPSGPRGSYGPPLERNSREIPRSDRGPNPPMTILRRQEQDTHQSPPLHQSRPQPLVDQRQSMNAPSGNSSVSNGAIAGVHPSRLAQLSAATPSTPVSHQPSAPQGPRGTLAPSHTPSGPRSNGNRMNNGVIPSGVVASSPTEPSHGISPIPSGPAGGPDRPRRNERDGQRPVLLSANSGPAGGGSQDVSFRGASSRKPSGNINESSVQSIASPMEPPVRRPELPAIVNTSGRPSQESRSGGDLFQKNDGSFGRNNGFRPNAGRPDDAAQNGYAGNRPKDDEGHTRNGPGPRLHDHGQDKRLAWDPRDASAGARNYNGPPRSDVGSWPTAPSLEIARNNMPPADWSRGEENRGMHARHHDGPGDGGRRGGHRGGRNGGESRNPGGPWPDERNHDVGADDGRKRRHEEMPFDPTKRRRGGRYN